MQIFVKESIINNKMEEPHKDLKQLYEELTEMREKAHESKEQKEDATIPLLKDLANLSGSILDGLRSTDRAAATIFNGTDKIRLNNFESLNTLHMGKNSVKHLIEVTKTATKVFAAVKENNSDFKEELIVEHADEELEQIKSKLRKTHEYVQYLRSSIEGLRILQNLDKGCDPSVFGGSVSESEPQSGFGSFLENSMITSSPLPRTNRN